MAVDSSWRWSALGVKVAVGGDDKNVMEWNWTHDHQYSTKKEP